MSETPLSESMETPEIVVNIEHPAKFDFNEPYTHPSMPGTSYRPLIHGLPA